MTNFEKVCQMNEAFGNAKGDPKAINWERVRAQCINLLDEFIELNKALGANDTLLASLAGAREAVQLDQFDNNPDLENVRDALCDINVFSYGAHHLMGIDANKDMQSVVGGVMTRFIKDDEDKAQSIAMHAQAGVTDVVFEGAYPTMIMRSASDQPDAPKGKFIKSASFSKPVFYEV